VSGDPITVYGDKKVEFDLPLHQWTTMLETPEFKLLAWPIPGVDTEQWIGSIAVVSPAGENLVQVQIRRDLAEDNRTALPRNAFTTLGMSVGPGRVPIRTVPSATITGIDSYEFRDVELAMGKVRFSQREYVWVLSPSSEVAIVSSSAREFYGEDSDFANKFAHLDLEITRMHRPERFGGALPELWGLRPPSAKTSAMVKVKESEEQATDTVDPQAFQDAVEICQRRANNISEGADAPGKESVVHVCDVSGLGSPDVSINI
jgi:hypothetical protein